MAVQPWLPAVGQDIVNPGNGKRYTIGANIGTGAFGAVHECTDRQTKRSCVAKFAQPRGVVADVRRRWRQECRLLETVNSRYIIQLYDYFRYGNVYWMVMERARCSLRERIDTNGPFDERNTILAAAHLLSALQVLNDKNIVHRDLHIDNILWSSARGYGCLKVADFGIAKQTLLAGGAATTRIGRSYDIAPDLLIDGYTTHRSDLYQLGLALYFMHTGSEALSVVDGPPEEAVLSGAARARAEQIGTPLGNYMALLLRRRSQYRSQSAEDALAELRLVANRYKLSLEAP